MAHLTNWIGIDDHADKLTIALYVGPQKQPMKEWEVTPTEAGLRQLVRWIEELKGPVHCVYEAGPCGYEHIALPNMPLHLTAGRSVARR